MQCLISSARLVRKKIQGSDRADVTQEQCNPQKSNTNNITLEILPYIHAFAPSPLQNTYNSKVTLFHITFNTQLFFTLAFITVEFNMSSTPHAKVSPEKLSKTLRVWLIFKGGELQNLVHVYQHIRNKSP